MSHLLGTDHLVMGGGGEGGHLGFYLKNYFGS